MDDLQSLFIQNFVNAQGRSSYLEANAYNEINLVNLCMYAYNDSLDN